METKTPAGNTLCFKHTWSKFLSPLWFLQISPLKSYCKNSSFCETGAPYSTIYFLLARSASPSQWWKHNKVHMDLQESSRKCLNIVTASAGCKEVMAQSCFRFSDVSLTCVMILRGRESLYCYLCATKSLRWLAEDINSCLSVLWICCSCVMSKAHFFTFWLRS